MSKSLKKLIDINRLREFKNKLVGTDSLYVQTGAVDQTVAGTKTFSKPIVGSVTGSSGSCTGNAATATTATTAKACTGNAATATKLQTARTINGTSFNGTANITTANWGTARNISITDGTNTSTAVSVNGSANVSLNLPATIKANLTGNCSGSSGSCTGNAATATTATTAKSCTGNAATATKLATARSLWGNNFDGSAAITGIITGTPAIEFMPAATSIYGGYLDFHYNHSTADYTSRIIESASGTLSINNVTITTEKVVTATTFNGALKGNVTGNCSGSSGSCTGNAATATKLAAKRTIALSGAATGTATGFDGSGNITIPVTALASSAIRAQWYAAYPDGAEAHNAMWGGRDITAAFDSGEFSEHIADGTFRDIFPGDYITKQVTISGTTYTVNWVIADCDYWWHKGDQNNSMETHHVVIVPQVPIFNANMNATNTTEGGYAGSRMYRETIPACATGIVSAFGSSHILTFRDGITNSVDTSHASSGIPQFTGTPGWWGEWVSVQCNLMSEKMVYGAPICSGGAMNNTMATRQMSAFRLSERLINYNRQWWWLRDVVSSTHFALVSGSGNANTHGASNVSGVRPFALLR